MTEGISGRAFRDPDQYYSCALRALADEGYEKLTIKRLCSALDVTSGSFYYHFGSWRGFVEGLVDYVDASQSAVLAAHNFGEQDPLSDVRAVRDLTVALNHKAEAALRAWSLNDDTVRTGMHRIDDRRYKTVLKTVRRVAGNTRRSAVLADLGMAMLIGYQHMLYAGRTVDAERMFDQYVELVMSHRRVC